MFIILVLFYSIAFSFTTTLYLHLSCGYNCCVQDSILLWNMLSILRNSCQRSTRVSSSFVVYSVGSQHHLHTWSRKKLLVREKFDCEQLQYLKLQKYDFRTTQHLHVPPVVAFLLRPIVHIGAAIMGRTIKRWWKRKPKEEQEEYKQWYKERRNVILGIFHESWIIVCYSIFLHDLSYLNFFTRLFWTLRSDVIYLLYN